MAKMRNLFFCIPLTLAWIAALVFATIYDLDISIAIADMHSVFGKMLEILGEPPAILFASFNFSILFAYKLKCTELRPKDKLWAALFAILSAGTLFYTIIKTCNYMIKWQDEIGIGIRLDLVLYLIALLIAAIFLVIFIMFALTLEENKLLAYYPIAKSCALAAVLTFIVIWALKLTWGRVRFRQLYGEFTGFTPWYMPNIGAWTLFSGNYSFPSGHTANSALIFSVTHYFRFLPPKYAFIKPTAYVFLALWVVTVALSRVVVGAHYLSDVLFGMGITFATVYFAKPRQTL